MSAPTLSWAAALGACREEVVLGPVGCGTYDGVRRHEDAGTKYACSVGVCNSIHTTLVGSTSSASVSPPTLRLSNAGSGGAGVAVDAVDAWCAACDAEAAIAAVVAGRASTRADRGVVSRCDATPRVRDRDLAAAPPAPATTIGVSWRTRGFGIEIRLDGRIGGQNAKGLRVLKFRISNLRSRFYKFET